MSSQMTPMNRWCRLMAKTTDPQLLKIAIVTSKFNEPITQKLYESAKKKLIESGVPEHNISSYWVAGAFEIPQVVKELARDGDIDGIIPLGCVIRGETPHFDYICDSVTRGLTKISLEHSTAITFGVLTVDTAEQALARTSPGQDKGVEASEALLQLISTLSSVRNSKDS